MTKKKATVISPNRKLRLDLLAAVRSEMSRIYRAVLCGHLMPDEAARMIYTLKEIRATLEAEGPPELNLSANPTVTEVAFLIVPPGYYLKEEDVRNTTVNYINNEPKLGVIGIQLNPADVLNVEHADIADALALAEDRPLAPTATMIPMIDDELPPAA